MFSFLSDGQERFGAVVGLIKLDFNKKETAVFNKGKLRLKYPPRYFMPATFRKAFDFSLVSIAYQVLNGPAILLELYLGRVDGCQGSPF
jgi:hypothetical protein